MVKPRKYEIEILTKVSMLCLLSIENTLICALILFTTFFKEHSDKESFFLHTYQCFLFQGGIVAHREWYLTNILLMRCLNYFH